MNFETPKIEEIKNSQEIKDTLKEVERGIRFLHWYWQAESGLVSDIWEGYEDLGVFSSEEEFRKNRKVDPPYPHLCGTDQK